MEDRGVDEVYIDFTQCPGGQEAGGQALARLMQRAIFDATGLTCSIGVAPNKLLAKMASEFNKPQRHLPSSSQDDLQDKIWPLHLPQDQRHRPQSRCQAAGLGHRHHRATGRLGRRTS